MKGQCPHEMACRARRNISSAEISLARLPRKSLSLRSASTTHKCRFSLSDGASKLKISFSARRALAYRSSFMISASSCSSFIAISLLLIVAGQDTTVLREDRLEPHCIKRGIRFNQTFHSRRTVIEREFNGLMQRLLLIEAYHLYNDHPKLYQRCSMKSTRYRPAPARTTA